MQKRLYFHIGSEKTGTTVLAKTLNSAASALLAEGILYPMLQNRIDARVEGDHRPLADAIWHGNTHVLEEELNAIAQAIRPGTHTIIISSEFLFHALSTSPHGEQGIDRIRAWANSLGFSFEVIAYLRRQDQLLESLYNQHIKWDSLTISFDDWVSSTYGRFDYDRAMAQWVQHCDVLHIQLYQADTVGNDIIGHFLTAVGATEAAIAAARGVTPFEGSEDSRTHFEKNLGLSDAAIEVIQTLQNIDPPSANAISDLIFAYGDARFYREPFEPSALFGMDWRERLMERYWESNSRLAARHSVGRPNGLFAPPSGSDSARKSSAASSLDLMAHLCLSLAAENRTRMFDLEDVTPGLLSPGRAEMHHWFPRGWCRPEEWGAWTLSEEADIVIKTAGNARWMRLHFDITAFVPFDHVQEATLSIEGRELAAWTLSAAQANLYPVIDVNLDPTKPVHTLKLHIPSARSPRSFGISEDHRCLGIGLRQMEIYTRQ